MCSMALNKSQQESFIGKTIISSNNFGTHTLTLRVKLQKN